MDSRSNSIKKHAEILPSSVNANATFGQRDFEEIFKNFTPRSSPKNSEELLPPQYEDRNRKTKERGYEELKSLNSPLQEGEGGGSDTIKHGSVVMRKWLRSNDSAHTTDSSSGETESKRKSLFGSIFSQSNQPTPPPEAPGDAGKTDIKRSMSLNQNWKFSRRKGRPGSGSTNTSIRDSRKVSSTSKSEEDMKEDLRVYDASKSANSESEVRRDVQFHIAMELLETEKNYFGSLTIMIEVFMKPLKENAKKEKAVLNNVDLKFVFAWIPELQKFTKDLILELEGILLTQTSLSFSSLRDVPLPSPIFTDGSTENIAESVQSESSANFEPHNPESTLGLIGYAFLRRLQEGSFNVYTKFVDNYAAAKAAIRRNEEQNPHYRAFAAECLQRKECLRQGILDFLIMPIQRIARYVLLLQDLKKNTPTDHQDYMLVAGAVDKMRLLANQVNEVKRKEEEMTRMFEIQKSVIDCPPTIISATRRVLMEAIVMEFTKQKPYRLILFNDVIVLARGNSKGLSIMGNRQSQNMVWKFSALFKIENVTMTDYGSELTTSEENKQVLKLCTNGAEITNGAGSSDTLNIMESNDWLFQFPSRKEKMELLITFQNNQRKLKTVDE